MAGSFQTKDRYTLEDLLAIMERLRSPGGCPWDREQTHESIATDFLEETHEALEAIRQRDTEGLKEELGDVPHRRGKRRLHFWRCRGRDL